MGNKAGCAARVVMNHGEMTMCFVGAHFDAGRGKVEKRNDNFAKISESLIFEVNDGEEDELSEAYRRAARGEARLRTRSSASSTIELGLNDHDIVFWFGDLNYRISKNLSDDQVRDMIRSNQISELREYDQLNIERFGQNVFRGYQEHVINFKPTYRFHLNTLTYDNERT